MQECRADQGCHTVRVNYEVIDSFPAVDQLRAVQC